MSSQAEERPILLIDALNLYTRSFAAYPTMSTFGYQMGGCIGFLKTLRRLVSEIQPSEIYVAWEGGGSSRRRKLFAEYKLGRRSQKLNRFYGDDIPDTEENRQHQIISLLGMLKCVPVCQLYVQECEGDDVIAYLCRRAFKDRQKIIVSSDKDMYQLLDQNTKQYSLHKKTFITEQTVLEEFRVQARNFAVAKALCGDQSDNVPGVKGLGFKTVSKLYPFLGLEQDVLLQDIFDYASSHEDESAIHQKVIKQAEDVKRNWKLVFLDGSMLSATQAQRVDQLIGTFKPRIDKIGLVKCMIKDGIGDFDVENFFYAFNCINGMEFKTT